ncbi:MAG: SemiSWEET transporter [Nitrospiraceae bacterium]|nr:SemiSWEET transporter [Nitrospiraceae bacterium]
MEGGNILGFAAGTLTTFSLVPQVVKAWRSRHTKDVSMGMFVTLCAGLLIWTVYGFSIHSLPVIITNIVSFVLGMIVIALKIKYG